MHLGDLVRVWYSDDTVWHERLVLLEGEGENMFWIVTPDLDVYEEDLGGHAVDGPERVRVVAHGARSRYNRPIYRFRETLDNEFASKFIKEAWREHESTYGSPPEVGGKQVHMPDGTVRDLSTFGPRLRIQGKTAPGRRSSGHSGEAEPREVVSIPEFVEDHDAWVVVYHSQGEKLGEQVSPPSGTPVVKAGDFAFKMFSKEGAVFLAQGCSMTEAPGISQKARKCRQEPDREDRDVRVLPVLFDTAEERWRTLAEAMPDYDEIEYEDFPLQGPRTMFRDLRQLRRLGMSFIQHHESWMRKSGVRTSDRSIHEHSSLCRALDFMASYDQLNLPALASAEALNRRRALIEIAHQGRPDAPSYEAAEEVLGVREAGDGSVVDPALTQHAAKRQAAKAEVLKQTRLAAEERKHATRRGEEEGGGNAERPGKGGGKKKKDEQSAP